MSPDLLVTLAIGTAASLYVGMKVFGGGKRLWETSKGDGPGCTSCSGCGTEKGHAESPESCSAKDKLVVLGERTQR